MPRNPRSAKLWAAVSIVAGMTTSLVVQGLTSPDGTNPTAIAAMFIVLVLGGLLVWLPSSWVAPWIVLVPLLGIAVIVRLDLPSGDAGVTGQFFFTIPVIFAAVHLRTAGTILVTAATVGAELLVVFSLLSVQQAIVDSTYVCVLLVLVAAVLRRAAVNQDRLRDELANQANSDPLTGLATRRAWDEEVRRLRTDGNRSVFLALVDIDHFKAVNDTFGHGAGDAALVHVAALLGERCRSGEVIARLGGDELAVLLVDASAPVAARRATGFVEAVRDNPLTLPDGAVVPLSVSVGTARLTTASNEGDPHALADVALYAAKRAGRGRAVHAPDGSDVP